MWKENEEAYVCESRQKKSKKLLGILKETTSYLLFTIETTVLSRFSWTTWLKDPSSLETKYPTPFSMSISTMKKSTSHINLRDNISDNRATSQTDIL